MKLLALARGQRLAWHHTKGALKPRIKTRWPSWKLQRLRMLMSATVQNLTLRRLMPRIAIRLPCRTASPIPAARRCRFSTDATYRGSSTRVGCTCLSSSDALFCFIQVFTDIK
jgi:hypothetical protein